MSWVIENSNVRGNNYVVLLMVANRADEEGHSAWPSVKWLAKRSRLSERTVQRSLRKLHTAGALIIEPRGGPKGTNSYHVVMQASLGGDKLTPRQNGPKGVTLVTPDTSLSVQNLKTPLPPASGGEEFKFKYLGETIAFQMGRHKRPPSLKGTAGFHAADIVLHLQQRGYPARIVA